MLSKLREKVIKIFDFISVNVNLNNAQSCFRKSHIAQQQLQCWRSQRAVKNESRDKKHSSILVMMT